jgi:hypothetical protein
MHRSVPIGPPLESGAAIGSAPPDLLQRAQAGRRFFVPIDPPIG